MIKKTFLITLLVISLFGCSKEESNNGNVNGNIETDFSKGIYHPGKRIHKISFYEYKPGIYDGYNYYEGYAELDWDGKKLQKLSYYSNENGYYCEIIYNYDEKGRFKEIIVKEDEIDWGKLVFSYSGDKLMYVSVCYGDEMPIGNWNYLISSILYRVENSNSHQEYQLTYQNDNIVKIIEPVSTNTQYEYEWAYDSYPNPFYGSWIDYFWRYYFSSCIISPFTHCPNNCISENWCEKLFLDGVWYYHYGDGYYNDVMMYSRNYSYDYDNDNYPTRIYENDNLKLEIEYYD